MCRGERKFDIFWVNFLENIAHNKHRRCAMARESKKASKKAKCCGACGSRDAECCGK